MLNSVFAVGGIVTAPHHLATDTGQLVLRSGGNAVEAMIAMAATIAVVYPHMNAIGGDSFWIVKPAGKKPIGIDACGAAASGATDDLYSQAGFSEIPNRGYLAANTVAGTLSGWHVALAIARMLGGSKSREDLLEAAIYYASAGYPTTANQSRTTSDKLDELKDLPGFDESFLINGKPPAEGEIFKQPRLAETLGKLASDGFDSFYKGQLADAIVADLTRVGSPVSAGDLVRHRALEVSPLELDLSTGKVWNMPPPTQGLASLMILGLFDRLQVSEPEGFDHIHGLVECVKQAFLVRNSHVQDPKVMDVDPIDFLCAADLDARLANIDPEKALPWPARAAEGDTVWMGAIDNAGNAVSFIQSIYWEFGSGVVLEDTGILWQNRGSSFSLKNGDVNRLAPGRRPFHTLNPAMAELPDGKLLSYGTMGGEGQPQTQALIYTRHVNFDQSIQQAITAPRFLLGRTWGDTGTNLKLENRFDSTLIERLSAAGHDIEITDTFSDLMGHAGGVSLSRNGMMEGGSDPRADGKASGF
ncbi:MAG: gamma-glutamyltransferase family protein [Pseudomonadota bacterium]|nr:gamma-glutamyltransferase family protein [Pseudomonadota bacterium]